MAKLTHPSAKIVQTFEMLKDGKSVNFEKMVKALGCKPVTAMVHICALRSDFGGDIDTERDGRKVISYRLKNPSEVAPRMVLKQKKAKPTKTQNVVTRVKTKTKVAKPTKVAGEVPTVDSEYDISEVTDAELADIKNQLGLG